MKSWPPQSHPLTNLSQLYIEAWLVPNTDVRTGSVVEAQLQQIYLPGVRGILCFLLRYLAGLRSSSPKRFVALLLEVNGIRHGAKGSGRFWSLVPEMMVGLRVLLTRYQAAVGR